MATEVAQVYIGCTVCVCVCKVDGVNCVIFSVRVKRPSEEALLSTPPVFSVMPWWPEEEEGEEERCVRCDCVRAATNTQPAAPLFDA